jgi:DNA-binding transcriptional ArsR family regulator
MTSDKKKEDRPQRPGVSEEDFCGVRLIHLDRVALSREKAIPDHKIERLASMFKVLGDPTRLRIVMTLRAMEMCVCDLAASLGLTESAVSHQLRRLRDLALVKRRREGQVLYYSLDDAHVSEFLNTGNRHVNEQENT